MKGVQLVQGSVVVLTLDGTMVYVEAVEPLFASVVALPDQPPSNTRVFTPGRVGAKKISPFAGFDKEVAVADLSQRNKDFIGSYESLRAAKGPSYVDRTPEELAAYVTQQAALNAPKKPKKTPEERAAAKAAKKSASGPRYLQRCTKCGEQPGHPNHPDDHAFEAPALPALTCAACDEPESADVHSKPKDQGGHKFVAGRPAKPAKAPKEKKAREPKAKPGPATGPFRWVGNDAMASVLAGANPKYKEGNTGAFIVESIKAKGEAGATMSDVLLALSQHPKFAAVSPDRVQVAFKQLTDAKLIEGV